MNTPICDFVRDYNEKNTLRLHMPGHKGRALLGAEGIDITEIDGADVLYSPKGIIAKSEKNAEELFGSGRTVYSAEGSSLCIRAMLYLASLWGKKNGKDNLVLAGRNAHRVFHSGAALLGLDVEWLYGESEGFINCNITPEYLERSISECAKKPFAVYLTSPDYLGNTLDLNALSDICRAHGVLCLVDNAHGAYLKFLPESRHPMDMGAHMCADSAHKTLPALTGAAYLHISKDAPEMLGAQADGAMSLFASTSPSYLILQSLDAVNKYISDGYAQKLAVFSEKIAETKKRLSERGYTLLGNEPLKITVKAKEYGYLGAELAVILEEKGIICEFCDRDYLVLMLTPEITEEELALLENVLCSIERKEKISEIPPISEKCERVLPIREALMSAGREVSVDEAVGCVLANAAISCPPAIPVAVCGERLTESAVKAMKYYGIERVFVL